MPEILMNRIYYLNHKMGRTFIVQTRAFWNNDSRNDYYVDGEYVEPEHNIIINGRFLICEYCWTIMPESFKLKDFLCKK